MSSDLENSGTGAWRPVSPAGRTRSIGKYEIKELIGAGAMGSVFLARDPDLDRDIAIKLMSPHVAQESGGRDRFLREARASGSLQHPNIITVYNFGEADGNLYIAMEYVAGRDLSDVIRNHIRLSLRDKIDVILGVLAGLSYAHDRGITHRDIKPSNIRLTTQGTPKVLDFGVAYLSESDLTGSGLVLGTPNYMAPEQVRGSAPTPAGDLFSVGAVFYELLTHRKPFDGDTAHAVLYSVASDEPVSLSGLHRSIPQIVRRVVERAMEKDPKNRYRSAEDMAEDLQRARRTLPESDSETTVVLMSGGGSRSGPQRLERRLGLAVAAAATAFLAINAAGTRATEPDPSRHRLDTAAVDIVMEPAADTVFVAPPAPSPDTLLVAVRNAALSRRVDLEAKGIPTALLVRGDSSIRTADSLEATGRFTEAVLALSAANTLWSDAEREHQQREVARAAQRRRPSRPTRPAPEPVQSVVEQPRPVPADKPAEPDPRSTDTAAISSTVARLERALESRQIARVRDVYRALTPKEERTWQDFFNVARDLEMSLSIHELQTFDDTAQAVVRGSYTFVTSSGEQRVPIEFPAAFAREGTAWRILHLGKTGS
jgi:serine/threonine-protein kinase